ncbi:MAG TPA: response regulator [Candidatus Hydrogenedentes bacterium]|nr:response regulator [Candidatus Hydrogenedentota bacterium]
MKGRILIIDDDPSVLAWCRRCLQRAGYEAEAVQAAGAAKDLLQTQKFDLAIVDLDLGETSGLDLLSWMQKRAPEVVPIILSGTTDVSQAIEAVQRGAFDYLAKPVASHHVLVQHVQRALDLKWLRERNAELDLERQAKSEELQDRLEQLELAHSILRSQAVAMQVELDRAMRVQRALLPKSLPFPDRLSLSVLYCPAAKVGGDFYDIFQLDDRHIGLYVADAAGHGASAAMLTVFLKLAVNPVAKVSQGYRIVEPGALLRALNHLVFEEDFGFDMFISMSYLVLNVETLEGRYSSAGHPPLLVRRAGREVEPLRIPAPALGLNPHARYSDGVFSLNEGDQLVLYSDGVLDARNAEGEFFGRRRLSEVIAGAQADAVAIARALKHDLAGPWSYDVPGDDVTVVVLGAAPQREPYAPPKLPKPPPVDSVEAVDSVEVRTAREGGRVFISVTGPGSWRESRRVAELVEQARESAETSIVLDLARCRHLDSTFYGVLHRLCTSFDEDRHCRFEVQNITPPLLREMSDLGLTSVLMHFRSRALPLPESMRPVQTGKAGDPEMGRLLLEAHEALVEADPRNADRFAAALDVLRAQLKHRRSPSETGAASREDEDIKHVSDSEEPH